jgi:hypothetical protein
LFNAKHFGFEVVIVDIQTSFKKLCVELVDNSLKYTMDHSQIKFLQSYEVQGTEEGRNFFASFELQNILPRNVLPIKDM